MEVQKRIKIIIKWLIGNGYADNQKEIGNLLGYTNESSFSQILNGKKQIPNNFFKKLAALDEKINIDWLLTGNGEMLKQSLVGKSVTQLVRGKGNRNVLQHAGNGDNIADSNFFEDKGTKEDEDPLKRLSELEFKYALLEKEVESLNKQLEEKERIIQLFIDKK